MRFIRVDKNNNVDIINTNILPIDYIDNEYRAVNEYFHTNERPVDGAPDLIEFYDDGICDTASEDRYILRKPKSMDWYYEDLLSLTDEDIHLVEGLYNESKSN